MMKKALFATLFLSVFAIAPILGVAIYRTLGGSNSSTSFVGTQYVIESSLDKCVGEVESSFKGKIADELYTLDTTSGVLCVTDENGEAKREFKTTNDDIKATHRWIFASRPNHGTTYTFEKLSADHGAQ